MCVVFGPLAPPPLDPRLPRSIAVGPQNFAIQDEFELPVAREKVALRERVALLTEASVPLGETTREDARLVCFDSDASDLLESGRDERRSLSVVTTVVLPEVYPVMIAGAAAVPVFLPAVAGMVSSALLAGGVAADAAPLAGEEMITVGVIILMDTGSELPAQSLESVRVTKDCLSVDLDVVLPEVSPAVFARAAAVPMSLTAMTEVVSSAVFAQVGRC